MGSKLGVKRGHYRLRHGYTVEPEPSKPATRKQINAAFQATARERGLEKCKKAERKHVNEGDPATSTKFYEDDETEFMMAMDEFKLRTGHKFPRWSEVLGVLKSLGYSK